MPAPRPMRRAQLISPFGVGSMVDFPGDVSLMEAGLDAWPAADQVCPPELLVTEERLQQRLGVNHFRKPPEYLDFAPGVRNAGLSVPFVRFPRYQYCPRCGAMRLTNIFGGRVRCNSIEKDGCGHLPEKRRRFLIPVRIVVVCDRGHIQDFPFHEWVHGRGSGPGDDQHRLRYVAGGSSAQLSGISIRCSCGKVRSLAGAFNFDEVRGGAVERELGLGCSADRPWLGEVGGQPGSCPAHLRVVQRGASNVYFPLTYSSIYLPLWAEHTNARIVKTLEDPKVWAALTSGLRDGRFIDRSRCEVVAEMRQLDPVHLLDAAQRKLDGATELRPVTDEEYRRHEYEAFRDGRGGEPSDLRVDRLPVAQYHGALEAFVREVGLIRRLRETRVLAGFTRITASTGPADRDRIQPLSRHLQDRWLPAIVVRGEGIFLDLDPAALENWTRHSDIEAHLQPLIDANRRRAINRGFPPRTITPKFVLLHTLAHVLIRQLANDCGYGSASLRERIYCDTTPGSDPMQGILIYTASGDSEGTMGGLVRQGEPGRLEYTIARALYVARWCSSDPICYESRGQGSDSGNLAACHGCTLLPETSCEEGNRLLDRQTLIGRPENPDIGFFGTTALATALGVGE